MPRKYRALVVCVNLMMLLSSVDIRGTKGGGGFAFEGKDPFE